MESVVRRVIADAGIDSERITSRVKDVESLVRKLPLHGYTSYDEVRDKAGVRIVVRLPRDVDAALEALAPALRCDASDIDDKRRIRRSGTRSVHVPSCAHPGSWTSEWNKRREECEIQIRTVCEDAWGRPCHTFAVQVECRPAHRSSSSARSSVSHLRMADREYERQYEAMYDSEGGGIVGILRRLAPEFVRLTGGSNTIRRFPSR